MRNLINTTYLICFTLIMTCLFSSVETTEMTSVLYVGGSGNGNYSSIQQAINNASSFSQILVYPGIYNESIDVYKSCHLKSIKDHKAMLYYEGNDDTIAITEDNCVIEGFNITHKTGQGYTSLSVNANNVTIKNNLFYKNPGRGLYFFQSRSCQVLHNQFVSDGIHLVGNPSAWASHTFINNTIDNKQVIYLKNTNNLIIQDNEYGQIILANCSEIIISNCSIGHGDQGILLGHCNRCFIRNNTIQNTDYGIHLSYSDNCSISSNLVLQNSYGIYLIHAMKNIVFLNNISLQDSFGIWICCNSKQNLVYHNIFFNNNHSAYDLFSNQWYLDSKGNYWSDYQGIDTNNDGIGENPYNIEGNTSQDPYPIIDFNLLKNTKKVKIDQTPFVNLSLILLLLITVIGIKKRKKRKKR